jgi:hypothetical protein
MGSLEIKEFTEAKTALKDIMTGMASYENMTISGKWQLDSLTVMPKNS